MEMSLNDEINADSVTESNASRLHPQRQNFSGALFHKKNNLKIEEDKSKSVLKVSNFREFLYTQLQPNYSIYLLIKRTENGFINSTYKIYFQENRRFVIACEKQGFSKYVFSSSEVHIAEDHISYLGKMESNFFGTEFQMYDSGEEHTRTKMMEHYKKQLASVRYSQDEGCPRRVEALITTSDNKSTDFTILDKDNDILQSRAKAGRMKSITKLISKDPSYDPN
jgi:protease II